MFLLAGVHSAMFLWVLPGRDCGAFIPKDGAFFQVDDRRIRRLEPGREASVHKQEQNLNPPINNGARWKCPAKFPGIYVGYMVSLYFSILISIPTNGLAFPGFAHIVAMALLLLIGTGSLENLKHDIKCSWGICQ
ncbi:hypothetical protein BDN71DRAFT_1437128 [Pleurotus eryngii]|uniref:Uncharacterized protein n=1 Tax=Pleurotus eryngii TaxID=5323 RepID=A0A9P5ZH86_PLEER|nr:hypothetical protein BDN71DRAFT_1437128 [Pleurotus eryngii]